LTALLTVSQGEMETITPMAWMMPVSGDPPLMALSIKPTRFAYELMIASHQFALNLPFLRDVKKVWQCGITSGRERNKFAMTGFTRMPALKITAPTIVESAAILECQLQEDLPCGDHRLVIAEVILARVRPELYDEEYNAHFEACLHLRKDKFLPPDWSGLVRG
jgi:flavin reductase (DIM6/NTAB) family NADH-FMN oxidoreductase RutF